jgi:microcin C transport system substrate-binding protein
MQFRVKWAILILLAARSAAFARASFDGFAPVKKGGTFSEAIEQTPLSLVPLLITTLADREISRFILMPLLERDFETFAHVPALAEKLEVSRDKKEYTFTLDSRAKWSDGTAVTSDDMIFTFEKIMDPKVEAGAVRAFLEGVSITKIDQRRFKFRVLDPKYDSADYLATLYPIQKKQFENEADFNKSKETLRPIGNGPYRVRSISRDQSVILERVTNWWAKDTDYGKARANFDQLQLKIIAEATLRYESWVKGDLDTTLLSYDQFALQARGSDKDKVSDRPGSDKPLWAKALPSNGSLPWWGVALNYKTPVFAGVKTRQALAMLVDYESVKRDIYHGLVEQSVSPFGSRSGNAPAELKNKSQIYRFDRAKAAALLKADGWSDTNGDSILDKAIDGKRIDFKFVFQISATNQAAIKFAQFYKETVKKAGIEVVVRPMDSAAFFRAFDESAFEATLISWGGGSIYPNPRQLWASSSIKNGSNRVGYSNPKVDKLIEKANTEFNQPKRSKILQEINRMIYNDVPYIFLFERNAILQGFNSRLKSPRWSAKYSTEVDKQFFYKDAP